MSLHVSISMPQQVAGRRALGLDTERTKVLCCRECRLVGCPSGCRGRVEKRILFCDACIVQIDAMKLTQHVRPDCRSENT